MMRSRRFSYRTVAGFRIGEAEEELLSYLTGRAPVGHPFDIWFDEVRSDIGLQCRRHYFDMLQRLERKGLIDRSGRRRDGVSSTRVVVLKRLEELR